MTVTISVSDVRRELYSAAGAERSAGPGNSSTQLLGQLFHEVVSGLLTPEGPDNLEHALAESEADLDAWTDDLVEHAYRRWIGPRLLDRQSVLQQSGRETLDLWEAVREACRWLAEISWTLRDRTDSLLQGWVIPQEPLSWELREPDWTDHVQLTGIPDAIFRLPDAAGSHSSSEAIPGGWCLIELKLGRTALEADLAQAGLYHQLLKSSQSAEKDRFAPANGALALVGFLPRRKERVFSADELLDVQERLKAVIGRVAGVLPEQKRPARPTRPLVSSLSQTEMSQGRGLVEAFREYGAPIELDGEPIAGPSFLRYPAVLGRGVKLATLRNRVEEVQLRLGLSEPPMIDMADGRVVIDLQRPEREFVSFSQIQNALPAPDPLLGNSRVPIGIDLNGELGFADLAETEHCHLLVAGTTGSGKTEWLRTALAGLLVSNTPETLQLVLIDPKRNAFRELRDSPFLERPLVYPDETPVAEILSELADEMDRRYGLFEGADSLSRYVQSVQTPLRRIVCICDEYFDVINRGRQERRAVEEQIFRLGAKARAAGIHLILATQQPSREVVKGALDSNIPARVGLKTNSAIESRMLLGSSGAENLLGYGDLLFKDIGSPTRLQSACLTSDERQRIFGASAGSASRAR